MPVKVTVVSDAYAEAVLAFMDDPDVITGVIEDVMAMARAYWIKLAGERLRSTRREYQNGIQDVVVEGQTASVSLVGALPVGVEEGMSPFDMHDTLLGPNVPVVPVGSGMKGKHVLKKGGGFWRVVPFSHQTPGSAGLGGGAPMGSQFADAFQSATLAKALGKAVHAAAKKLAATTSMPGGKTQWGGRLPEGMAPLLRSHHATDIFAGMVREEKIYEEATQSTYKTFRIISDNVKGKWLHPGLEAAHLADEVVHFIEQHAHEAFGGLLESG